MPELSALRQLLSNETYLKTIGGDFVNSNLVVDSILSLMKHLEVTQTESEVFEFTWLMINVAYLCSSNQISQL